MAIPEETEPPGERSEEHTSELQSHSDLVCRLLLEKKKTECAGSDAAASKGNVTRAGGHAARGSRRGLRRSDAPRPGGLQPVVFFFNDTATTEIYTLSLHDALPI